MKLQQKLNLITLLKKNFDLNGLKLILNALDIDLGTLPDNMDRLSTEIVNRSDLPQLKKLLIEQTHITEQELNQALDEPTQPIHDNNNNNKAPTDPNKSKKSLFATLIGIATLASGLFAALAYFEMIDLSLRPLFTAKPNLNSPACQQADDLLVQAHVQYQKNGQTITQQQINWLQQAVELCPTAEAYNNLASTLTKQDPKDYASIIKHYRHALRLNPSLPQALYGLGETYYQLEEYPKSHKLLLKICDKHPKARERLQELAKTLNSPVPNKCRMD